jgi:hypothetical protein
MKDSSAENQLDRFLAKFWPEIEELARAVLKKMRARLPGSVQMVYDNFNWLVIGFSPTERPSDAIFSVVIAPKSVFVCFLQGAKVPDPHKLLRGDGKVVRNLRIEEAEDLDDPRVKKLIDVALKKAKVPMTGDGPGQLVIRAISKKQRPRRPVK